MVAAEASGSHGCLEAADTSSLYDRLFPWQLPPIRMAALKLDVKSE